MDNWFLLLELSKTNARFNAPKPYPPEDCAEVIGVSGFLGGKSRLRRHQFSCKVLISYGSPYRTKFIPGASSDP